MTDETETKNEVGMLAAAPAVQGEPVGWQFYQNGEWRNGDDRIKDHRKNTEEAGHPIREVYAAPQPAEQQPAPALSKFLEKEEWNDAFAQGFDAGFNSDEKQQPDVTQLVEALEACDTALFCDLKTDEEKSTFFLSGRGYETGVIAQAIQNDVAMAYHRCSEYREEMEALQAECERLREALEDISGTYHHSASAGEYFAKVAREALAAYRKGDQP